LTANFLVIDVISGENLRSSRQRPNHGVT